jgi:hypothetical protein
VDECQPLGAGDWFYRFDTRQPCYNNGLPLTLVVPRYDLLDILRNAVRRCRLTLSNSI